MQGDMLMPEERKQRQLQQLGKKESTFLRMKRTKLGVDDFRTVKVIGKGAFGEVRVVERAVDHVTDARPGPPCAEEGHGEDICHEVPQQAGDVAEGPGALLGSLTQDY